MTDDVADSLALGDREQTRARDAGRPGGGAPRAIAAGLGAAAAGIGVSFLAQAVVLLPIALLGIVPPVAVQLILVVLLTQGVAFGGVALLYYRSRRLGLGYPRVTLPRGPHERRWLIGGYLLALAAAAAGGLLAAAAGLEPAASELADIGMGAPWLFLLLIPLAFLIIGPGEELLFRGVIQRRLRRAMGPAAAVITASAIFAAAHVLALTGALGARLVTVAILFLPSLVLGAAYERTGNLVVPIIIHGGYNATLFALAYAGATSGQM